MSDKANIKLVQVNHILITNLVHQLLFIYKILLYMLRVINAHL